jgi:hypothetical protein
MNFDKRVHDMAVKALPIFDQLVCELKDENPQAIQFARSCLHDMIDVSKGVHLVVLLSGAVTLCEMAAKTEDSNG